MSKYYRRNINYKSNYYRKRKLKNDRARIVMGSVIICILVIVLFVLIIKAMQGNKTDNYEKTENLIPRPDIDVELLTVNEYSRPAIAMEKIKGIVVHYTANPGTSAIQNRNYFEGLKDQNEDSAVKVSSHFVIGLDGEIVQCIPSSEISYASNNRNKDTLSIECCHPDSSGKFNDKTYDSLVHLTAWLCLEFDVKLSEVIRHYDVTGKNCPKYYVENKGKWDGFISDVKKYIKKFEK